ncbi:MAG: hypothetical protein H7A18_03235 [Sinobacteraceae bacterium]|nr:hypothetical protein [Nevskiaceae bacterium]
MSDSKGSVDDAAISSQVDQPDSPLVTQLPWPPGFTGRLANFIYHSSYSPVPEVAIVASLALMAGVSGRAYRTHTGKDLALYIILIAKSGIGKDGIHEGIPKLVRMGNVPLAADFVRQTDFVSGPALHKAIIRTPGFLYLKGEFGRQLKRMANPMDTPMQELRTVMTNVYAKSYYEGRDYSNSENSMLGVEWPALSFLGETTPGSFLDSLTDDMMEDGFMSRFFTVSHTGQRPKPNEAQSIELEPNEARYWKELLEHTTRYQNPINMPAAGHVGFRNSDAYDKIKKFENDCIDCLNSTDDEWVRQMYNRAHLKALKIASLLAVADNYAVPKIDLGHVAWAITWVREDMAIFQRRSGRGEIGDSDQSRERRLADAIERYLTQGAPDGYKIPPAMKLAGVVPRKYLQISVQRVSAFTKHKLGQNAALDLTLRSMVDSGYLKEELKDRMVEQFNFHGKCYRVLALPPAR